jgi:hypothetical protein
MDCSLSARSAAVQCDYRTPEPLGKASLTLTVDRKKRQPLSTVYYPGDGQKTAALVLIDISDAARKRTVTANVSSIRKIVAGLRPHQKIGVAVFDSEFRLLAPVGADVKALNAALDSISAGGMATEFYKSVIAGAKYLRSVTADRRALILMSDGKAEDSAYRREDAVKAFRDSGLEIIGLGYAERASDTPQLQVIERLAVDTGGEYIVAGGDASLPQDFVSAPFANLETGGQFTFDASDLSGNVAVKAKVTGQVGKAVELRTQIDVDANRTFSERLRALSKKHPLAFYGGIGFLIAIAVAAALLRRRAKARKPRIIEYGYLQEMDGQGTKHRIFKGAVRIGRGKECDIVLTNDTVSSKHAELIRRDDGWHITDLASANGLFVNDEKVVSVAIADTDLIEIGEVRLRFHTF